MSNLFGLSPSFFLDVIYAIGTWSIFYIRFFLFIFQPIVLHNGCLEVPRRHCARIGYD